MPGASSTTPPEVDPYYPFRVTQTDHGIEIQLSVRDDSQRHPVTIALMFKSAVVIWLLASDIWTFLGATIVMGAGDLVTLACYQPSRLGWIEVRPDGLTIDGPDEERRRFYHRRAIEDRQLDFDEGLTLKYGIHELKVMPGFTDLAQFLLLEKHLEQLIARIWFQQNMGT